MFKKKTSVKDMENLGFFDIFLQRIDDKDYCEAVINVKVGRKLLPLKLVTFLPRTYDILLARSKVFNSIIDQYESFKTLSLEDKKEYLKLDEKEIDA